MDPRVGNKAPPAFAEDLRHIIPSGTGDTQLPNWMDAKFGPDGALYLLDYGGGFFSLTPRQKLIRITYQGGPATPSPGTAAARVVAQGQPRTVAFTGAGAGGVSWRWDFGDGSRPSTTSAPGRTTAGSSRTW